MRLRDGGWLVLHGPNDGSPDKDRGERTTSERVPPDFHMARIPVTCDRTGQPQLLQA